MVRSVAAALFVLCVAAPGADVAPDLAQTPAGSEPRGIVRVHHLHFHVGDPAAAMQAYADRLGGTRTILQGLGVGVRVGTHYLLFDRDRGTGPARADVPDAIRAAYRSALPWLSARGVQVQSGDFESLPLAALTTVPPLDHIAFVSADYAGTVDLIVSRGGTPVSRTSDAALFAAPDGTRIEVVRDTDAPDAFWCPMHPDVRSSSSGKCPICAMDLVPIPPPKLGEYRMDVGVSAGAGGRGLGAIRVTLREPESSARVDDFSIVHERLLHLFLVGRDLEYFAHVHPDRQPDGSFSVAHAAPPGEYVVIADFVPKAGTSQMLHRAIVTPGFMGSLFAPAPELTSDLPEASTRPAPSSGAAPRGSGVERAAGGVTIRLEGSDLMAGKRGTLRFSVYDAAHAPVTDLEPFLGAPGHMLLVNPSLTEAIHVHPEEQDERSPNVTFMPLLPAPGLYKLWVQFQRRGTVITAPFVIRVGER